MVPRSQNSQDNNPCRVTTDANYTRYPSESLYLPTFVPWIRLDRVIYKTKIKDRLKRARVRTDPTTHIPTLNFPGGTRKTVGLVNPTPAKRKTKTNATFSSFCLSVNNPILPTSQRKKKLNDENKINTTAPEKKPNLNLNLN